MSEAGVIDEGTLKALLEAVGGDLAFLSELIDTYLSDSPAQLAAMQSALSAGDPQELRRAAHSLKSNSASFGAQALAQVCKELEEMGKSGALERAGAHVARAKVEFEKVSRALEEAQAVMANS
jgi:HPt (histidine-containing phosphotransfer) domain-containing protein